MGGTCKNRSWHVKKDLRFFPHDSATATGASHRNPKANWVQNELSLHASWNLWVNVMKFLHKGCPVPFELRKNNRHTREELRRPLQEAGKAIFFKITINGMISRCLLWSEEGSRERIKPEENKTTISQGNYALGKGTWGQEKNVSLLCGSHGRQLGMRWKKWLRKRPFTKSERGSVPLLLSDWVNEEVFMTRTE